MMIAEKLTNMCFSKVELREVLDYDEYLELDFISEELKIPKESIIEEIKKILETPGKQKWLINKKMSTPTNRQNLTPTL